MSNKKPLSKTTSKTKQASLTRKDKLMLDKILANPMISNTQAYLETHETNNRKSASVQATRVLKKPSSQIYLQKHVQKASERIVELVDSDNDNTALKASQDILNRTYGTATKKTENVNLNIEAILNSLE